MSDDERLAERDFISIVYDDSACEQFGEVAWHKWQCHVPESVRAEWRGLSKPSRYAVYLTALSVTNWRDPSEVAKEHEAALRAAREEAGRLREALVECRTFASLGAEEHADDIFDCIDAALIFTPIKGE